MWTVTWINDTDDLQTGTATATWTEDGLEPFQFSQRVDSRDGTDSIGEFIDKAMEELAEYKQRQTHAATIAVKIATALNEWSTP